MISQGFFNIKTLGVLILDIYDLQDEVEHLICSRREDDYWDFKVKYHSNKANLIHDIICMANNRVDRDAYIIFGIVDETFDIVGVENDENRKNQQNIIDLLKSKKFASGIRPRVEMRTLIILNHEVDVLIIKNSTDTPYFLIEDFRDGGRTVRANYIYTRVGDTNTDIDKSADINNIEYLWKKRFLLTRPPFEQILKRLENKNEWKRDEYIYFNIYNPEFTISIEDDDERNLVPEFYAYAMTNESTMYEILNVNYYGTNLYNWQVVVLDGGRYATTVPEWEFLCFSEYKSHPDFALKYFTKDDPSYKLNEFLYDEGNEEERYARQRLFQVVLLFEDIDEKDKFLKYVHENKEIFYKKLKTYESDYTWIETNNKRRNQQIVARLRTGKALNQMLNEYRINQFKHELL